MKHVMVRYKVKRDHVARNEELVRAVYDELHEKDPPGLRYATFRLDDGVTFVHFASMENEGPSPLLDVEAFGRFQEAIGERCDEAPVVTELSEIGSFRLGDSPPAAMNSASQTGRRR
jgi:hypothetical protein